MDYRWAGKVGKNPLLWVEKQFTSFAPGVKCRLRACIPDIVLQVWGFSHDIERNEPKKVAVTSTPCSAFVLIHVVALLGACTIVTLNCLGVWVGEELMGESGEGGQNLFILQLIAKIHEILMVTSLSRLAWGAIMRSLIWGNTLPLAVFGIGVRLPEVSLLWSRELAALRLAKFPGKKGLLLLVGAATVLGIAFAPASATGIQPSLAVWPAGSTPVVLNVARNQLWPPTLNRTSPSQLNALLLDSKGAAAHWSTFASAFFEFWGERHLGQISAVPEIASVPARGSVRSFNVRFRGPFSLYQPLTTAATTQPVAAAEILTAISMLWDHYNNNRCTWAKHRLRITSGVCGYRDIQWTLRAQQPVVYTKCATVLPSSVVRFPAINHSGSSSSAISYVAESNLDLTSNNPLIQWVELQGSNLDRPSLGALVRTRREGTVDIHHYACTIQAQWGRVAIKSSFLGTPFQVTGYPPNFFEPEISWSQYRGTDVKIDATWASDLTLNDVLDNNNQTAIDIMLSAGASNTISEGKVEASLAVVVAENMAWTNADAVLQHISGGDKLSWGAFSDRAIQASSETPERALDLEVTVTGFAYGIRQAAGISTSILLSTIILTIYVVLSTLLVVMELWSRRYVHAWNDVTDLIVLSLQSDASPLLHNTSAGVGMIRTLTLPVILQEKDGGTSLELVVDASSPTNLVARRPVRLNKAYG